MSQVGLRGGYPQVIRIDATGTVQHLVLAAQSSFLKMRSMDNDVSVFFNAADANAGVNFVTVPAPSATHPYGEWSGPVWTPSLYVSAPSGGSMLEIVAFLRQA